MTRASDTAKLLGAGATILDGTTISTADNDPQLILKCTDTDASTGPKLDLERNPGEAGADGDNLAQINFYGYNDASEKSQYLYLFGEAADVANGSEDVRFGFGGLVAGADSSLMTFTHGTSATGADPEMVFNDSSKDINFRVESNGDANMLFVDGGNDRIGIGTNSPDTLLHLSTTSGDTTMRLTRSNTASTGNNFGTIEFENSAGTVLASIKAKSNDGNTEAGLTFGAGGGNTERLRLTADGRLLLGTTSVLSSDQLGVVFDGTNFNGLVMKTSRAATGSTFALFLNSSGGGAGSISHSGSTTVAYNTSSDYRLKENVTYDFDATTRLKQLKPARFNFIADGTDRVVDGFLAHEVSSIVPEAITGEKDAMTAEVLYVDGDEIPDGKKVGDVKEASKIDPQGIDQSKIVPLLVKTIQELEARITTLENA